jgi:hypothetical protein
MEAAVLKRDFLTSPAAANLQDVPYAPGISCIECTPEVKEVVAGSPQRVVQEKIRWCIAPHGLYLVGFWEPVGL